MNTRQTFLEQNPYADNTAQLLYIKRQYNLTEEDIKVLRQILDLPLLKTFIDIELFETSMYDRFNCAEFIQVYFVCIIDNNIINEIQSTSKDTTILRDLILNKYVEQLIFNLKGYNIKFNLSQLFRKIYIHINDTKKAVTEDGGQEEQKADDIHTPECTNKLRFGAFKIPA